MNAYLDQTDLDLSDDELFELVERYADLRGLMGMWLATAFIPMDVIADCRTELQDIEHTLEQAALDMRWGF